MARVLALLFLAGAATGALTLILPHDASANDSALWTNIAAAFAGALVLAGSASRMRPWMLQVALVIGILTITRAIYYGGSGVGFYALWYVWVGLFSFFFFERRWALFHVALVGLAYAWALAQLPPGSAVVRWIMTVGTVAIGGSLVEILIGRLRRRAEAARTRARALELVSKAAHELARQTTSEAAGVTLCQAAAAAAGGALSASLWEPSADGRALVATASTDPSIKGVSVFFVGAGSALIDAFTSGEPRFAANAAERPAGDPGSSDGASLLQPVVLDRIPVGVLAIEWHDQVGPPTEELSQVIALLALEGALALQHAATLARLERVARTDDLTGLANRRAWDEHVRREIARAKRNRASLAVALLDLDRFKRFNDRHGHPAGDRLLKQVGASWARAIRATDILARYGGEEFALALPGATPEDAMATLERMRADMPDDQKVSAGLVFWDGTEDEIGMIARADRALYAAKDAGRDRVLVG
jgi:diguanylate cyclase (GGDEF)-like protein